MGSMKRVFVLLALGCATPRTPCPPPAEVSSAEPVSIDGAGWVERTFAALHASDPELSATVLARGDVTDDDIEDAIIAVDRGRTRSALFVWNGGAQILDTEHDLLAAIIGHRGARLRVGTAFGRECEGDVYEEQWTWNGTELTRASTPPRLLRAAGCED